jgi:hypothetical protein
MKTLAFALLLLAFCASGVAQTVSVVQDNLGNNAPLYYFHQRKVARTPEGLLLATWTDKNAAGGQVVFATYDDAFQSWSPATAISNAADRALQSALAADESGNIHAVWIQRATSTARYQVFYAKFNGISWTTPTKVSVTDADPAEEATIEVDSRGYIWVVYNNDGAGNGKEFILAVKSTNGGTSWSAAPDTLFKVGTLGSSIEVARVSLASGPNGRMVAVWDNSLTGTNTRREVFANQYDGTSWGGEVLISDTTSVDRDHNRYTSIAVDRQSNIYVFQTLGIISGADKRLRKLLMHKKSWGAAWTLPHEAEIDADTISFLEVSAVADTDNVIHLAYRRDIATDTLALDEMVYTFSKDGGTTWAPRFVLSRPQHDAGYLTIGNRVRKQYGVDILWRESRDILRSDQDTTAVVYANIPYSMITAVENDQLPVRFETLANYPNPFNPSTMVTFGVIQRGAVSLVVYDVLGREVRTLVNDVMDPGAHQVRWDGRNNSYLPATSGVYVARLSTVAGSRTTSMLLLK